MMRRDYNRVNWVAFSRLVDSRLSGNPHLPSSEAIDQHLNDFQEALHSAENACIRWVSVKRKFAVIDMLTQQIIQQRNTVRRQFQRTGCPLKKQELSHLNKLIGDRMTDIRNKQFSNDIKQMRDYSKPFWKVAKVLKKKPQTIPPLKEDTGEIFVSSPEKANAIARKLFEAHNLGASMVSPHEHAVQQTINQLNSIEAYPFPGRVTEDDVRTAIKAAKNMKAPVLNRCFQLQYFPTIWKVGKVIPILKPGKDPTAPASYRPITLLSAVSKLFERLILQRLMAHFDENDTITPVQFGFHKGLSTVHQLVRVENTILRNKALSNNTAIVLLDVEKAFDNVWHNGLVHKLVQAKVPGYLAKLVSNYLTDRFFSVRVAGSSSVHQHVPAGVPQGSLLGPILYNLYPSDVPQLPADCILALYADDSAIMANGRTPKIYRSRLQRGVTAYVAYLSSWKIKVNEAKNQVIIFRHRPSPKLLPPPDCFIRVNGCPVVWFDEVNYLGITLDNKRTYRAHTDKLKYRCIGLLKSLYPLISRRSRLSQKNKLAIFKTIIAPVVNYAMPVWGTCAEMHKKKLQVVQNRLLRTILDAPYDARISDLHRAAGCKTIAERIDDSINNFIDGANQAQHHLIRELVN